MNDILDMTREELGQWLAECGEPRYRADQVWQWLWRKGANRFEDMTNLSRALRERLAGETRLFWPEVADTQTSGDGTVKLLLRLHDGEYVETVLIPEVTHYTQCVSTQVGCAMACTFCSTGRMGFTRNLSSGEILGQVLVGRAYVDANIPDQRNLRNLVFMGMGEPLANLRHVLRALKTFVDPDGFDFSPRRMTVSTVGLSKGLMELGESGLASLAVSLHAPTQELRAQLMPRAAELPLDKLMALLDRYPLKPRQRITFEYLLLRGVNDSMDQAKGLVRLLGQRKKCKVNLIAYNAPAEGAGGGPDVPDYLPPDPDQVERFENYLRDHGITVLLRRSKGADIKAACGQLKVKHQS